MTNATDRNASLCRVIASRKDRVLELKLHWLPIALLGVEASAMGSQNLLDAIGSAPGYVRDLGARRSRQRQEPQRLLIDDVDAVKGQNVTVNVEPKS